MTTTPGTVGPMAVHTVFGTCGWSSIEVRNWNYSTVDHLGYLKAAFGLNKPGTTYATDVLLFSSSVVDLWTAHVNRSGSLNGGTQWSTAGQFAVPKDQKYGGTLINAWADTADGRCYTSGPRVDGVRIN